MKNLREKMERAQTYDYATSSWRAFFCSRLLALYGLVWRVAVLIAILLAITAPIQMLRMG